MRIWITGIAGFIGSRLAIQLIAEGHIVSGNDNLICGSIDNIPFGIIWNQASCCNYDEMTIALKAFTPEILVHCAATAHEGLSTFSPSFITRNIFEASVSTFSAAIASGVKRIVYMSSMARYGRGVPPFRESDKTAPVDPYGIAKVAAEDTLKVLCETHGVKWTIAVPHNVIGVGQRYVDPYRNVAAIMINRCKQGKGAIIYGDGIQKRCFSPINDCLPSLVRMIHGDADGEIVNIGPDNGEITIKELANTITSLTECTAISYHMPMRPNEVKVAYTSSDKARRILGFESKQSLDSCLKEMVEWIEPKPFIYDFPLEIVTDKMPKTWLERLM